MEAGSSLRELWLAPSALGLRTLLAGLPHLRQLHLTVLSAVWPLPYSCMWRAPSRVSRCASGFCLMYVGETNRRTSTRTGAPPRISIMLP